MARAGLDSNIIYSRVLHELVGRLGLEGRLLDLIWSDELLAEAARVLREHKGLEPDVADRWVGHLRRSFPAGQVTPQLPARLDLSQFTRDPGDEFVCALAIAGGADYLFTFDKAYLRDPMREHGVEVASLDAWLERQLDEQEELVQQIVQRLSAAWGGGRPLPHLLDAFERARVPVFAERLRALS